MRTTTPPRPSRLNPGLVPLHDREAAQEDLSASLREHGQPAPPPESPCDHCQTRARCAVQVLACEAFGIYANVGGVRLRWEEAPRQPSKMVFDRLFTKPFKEAGELSGMSVLERRAAVKRLADNGHSRRVIAELLGVVKSTVLKDLAGTEWQAKPRIFKTPRESNWLTERRARSKELAEMGCSKVRIAEVLRVNTVTVSRDLRHAGAVAPPDDHRLWRSRGSKGRFLRTAISEQRESAVRELVLHGHSLREIAGIFGVHTNTVAMDLKRLGGRRNVCQPRDSAGRLASSGKAAHSLPTGGKSKSQTLKAAGISTSAAHRSKLCDESSREAILHSA